jgi:hypothetical protein
MATKRDKVNKAVQEDMESRELPQRETATYKELNPVTVRLSNTDKRKLAAHFRLRYDVGLSTGIRILLKNYMDRENI